MTFMILLKPYVWEKSGSRVKRKNALSQSDCRILELQTVGVTKMIFLHTGVYLLKLQIDDMI